MGESGLWRTLLTKFVANDVLSKHAQRLSLSFKLGKSSADKAAEALAGLSSLEARLRVFTKRVAIAKTLRDNVGTIQFADQEEGASHSVTP